jgi:hypothetical protein
VVNEFVGVVLGDVSCLVMLRFIVGNAFVGVVVMSHLSPVARFGVHVNK